MPKAMEAALKHKYGADSDIPYKIMNSLGVMHGNKVTGHYSGKGSHSKHEMIKKAMKKKY